MSSALQSASRIGESLLHWRFVGKKGNPVPAVTLTMRGTAAISCGSLALFFAQQSVQVLAIPFYQMTLAVHPLLLGMAMAIPLLCGSLMAAPVARFLSRSPHRQPQSMLLGLLGACITFAAMWLVPAQWNELWQLGYFALTALAFFLLLPLYGVAWTSWLLADADTPLQTARFTVVSVVHKLGSLGYQWLVPLCQLSLFSDFVSGVRQIGLAVAVGLIWIPGWFAYRAVRRQQATRITPPPSLTSASLRPLLNQAPVRWALALGACQLAGCAAVAGLDFYLLVYSLAEGDLSQGATIKAWLSSSYAVAGLMWVPCIAASSRRFGLLTTLTWVMLLNALGGVGKWFWFSSHASWWVLSDALACSAAWTAMVMLLPPLLARMASRIDHPHGAVAALHHALVSAAAALAMVGAGACVMLSGFDPQVPLTTPSQQFALNWMRITLSVGTVSCSILGLWFIKQMRQCQQPEQAHC